MEFHCQPFMLALHLSRLSGNRPGSLPSGLLPIDPFISFLLTIMRHDLARTPVPAVGMLPWLSLLRSDGRKSIEDANGPFVRR